jgi:hypothetical protein
MGSWRFHEKEVKSDTSRENGKYDEKINFVEKLYQIG